MDARLQLRVQRYGWDRSVADYEASWQRQLEPAQTLLLEMADLRPGERVVDIACGTGLVSIPAARAVGPGGEVVGTDISDGMVEAAREAAAQAGVENARFERMDAEDLALPDAAFDAALCALGLMYVPSPPDALREIARVLAPGGRTALAVWGARKNCGWAEIFPIVDARVSTEVCPLFFQLGTGDTLARTAEDAGFTDVVTERITTVLRYESGDHAIRAVFQGGPVTMAYSRFDEATREEAHAEYLESIAAYRNGDGYEIPGEFVVVRGVKG